MVIAGGSQQGTIALVRAALRGGATAIQLRWKRATTRELIDIGEDLRALTGAAGALLIINDRVDVAMAVGADGAHLGDDDLPLAVARRIVPPGFVLGRSVDTVEEARTAEALGADYVGLGPIFPTASKSDTGPVVGVAGIAAFTSLLRIPVVAIGGIDARSAAAVIAAGADGVAVITAVSDSPDPEGSARALMSEIQRGRGKR
jgi:thiamine-phosphate pyrophosphorylase